MSNGETGLRVQREVGDARGLDLARRAPRRDESPARYAIDAPRDMLQGDRLTKEGNGKGAPALVGVVVTWETGDEKVAGSQRSWTLRMILAC